MHAYVYIAYLYSLFHTLNHTVAYTYSHLYPQHIHYIHITYSWRDNMSTTVLPMQPSLMHLCIVHTVRNYLYL